MENHDDTSQWLMSCLQKAREARNYFAPTYNTFYDLAAPERLHVNETLSTDTPRSPGAQDEVFDETLQQAVADFASDLLEEFTPGHRPWTKFESSKTLPKEFRATVNEQIKQRGDQIFEQIRRSSFEEAVGHSYVDAAIGPFAVQIRYSRAGKPINVEHVPLRELLILPGPYGGVGHRYRERNVPIRDLDTIFPSINWDHVAPSKAERKRRAGSELVIEGGYRDWSRDEETWNWYVINRNKVVQKRRFVGRGSCALIVGRLLGAAPTAYSLSVGVRALAPARALNHLAYLDLRRQGKIVDPPAAFSDPTSTFNPEQGLEPGMWYEAGPGFSIQELAPQTDARETFLKRDELRMSVLRALFQDKPYQRGLTPPTAAQWAGETAQMEKRKSMPRGRAHREWVIPIIERFEWIMEKRGELEPIEYGDQLINVQAVSPLSRAADLEDVQLGTQLLATIQATGEPIGQVIDTQKTFSNMKNKMGADVVELLTAEQRAAALQQSMAAQGPMGGEGGV